MEEENRKSESTRILSSTSFIHHIKSECSNVHLDADDLKWAVTYIMPLKMEALKTNASGKFLLKNVRQLSSLRRLVWKYCVEDEIDKEKDDDLSSNGNVASDWKLGLMDKLSVSMVKLRQMQQLFRLAHACPRITQLDLVVRGDRFENWPISLIYLHFPQLRSLTLNFQFDWQLRHVNGMPDDLLDRRHHDPKFRDRPAYIGDLKHLRYLAMKMDVSWYTVSWPNLDHLLRCGICHLTNLQEILLPPMVLTQGRKVLTLLAVCGTMSKLDKVTFQVDPLLQPAISEEDVKCLANEFQNLFVLPVDKIPIQFSPMADPSSYHF